MEISNVLKIQSLTNECDFMVEFEIWLRSAEKATVIRFFNNWFILVRRKKVYIEKRFIKDYICIFCGQELDYMSYYTEKCNRVRDWFTNLGSTGGIIRERK